MYFKTTLYKIYQHLNSSNFILYQQKSNIAFSIKNLPKKASRLVMDSTFPVKLWADLLQTCLLDFTLCYYWRFVNYIFSFYTSLENLKEFFIHKY